MCVCVCVCMCVCMCVHACMCACMCVCVCVCTCVCVDLQINIQEYIEGFHPELYISTMIYSGEIPFGLETLHIHTQTILAVKHMTYI